MMKKEKIVKIPAFITLLMLTAFICAVRAGAQEAAAPPAYRLIGTTVGKGLAGAVLVDGAGLQTFFRLHETAPDGSLIVAVESDSISLKRPDGARYTLYINHDMATSSLSSRPSRGPVYVAPSTADIQPSPDRQRFAPGPGGPGPVDTAREEARERHHNKPGRNAVDQGAETDQQNSAAAPNSSAAGADQTQRQHGPHPQGRRQPPGAPGSE